MLSRILTRMRAVAREFNSGRDRLYGTPFRESRKPGTARR